MRPDLLVPAFSAKTSDERMNMTKQKNQAPVTFILAKWWGYIFATFYLLYGGVSIILSIMDSNVKTNYDTMMQSILFLLIGVILITVATAFRDGKQWGWYGLIAINVLTMGAIVTRLSDPASLILGLICLAATILLFLPATRERLVG